MTAAQSPTPKPVRLRATHVDHPELVSGPRTTKSVYQAVATSRGYTVKAGSGTRARLYRGIPRNDGMIVVQEAPSVEGSAAGDNDNG